MSLHFPSHPSSRPRTTAAAVLLLTLSASLTACDGAERATSPDAEIGVSPIMVVDAQLLAAVDDAQVRVAPALDATIRPQVQSALSALHRALAAGHLTASQQALAQLQSLVAASAPAAADVRNVSAESATTIDAAHVAESAVTAVGGAADLAAIDMLVRAAQQSLAAAVANSRSTTSAR